jgi:hypothetical protein
LDVTLLVEADFARAAAARVFPLREAELSFSTLAAEAASVLERPEELVAFLLILGL